MNRIPVELWLQIGNFLTFNEVENIILVSKFFYSVFTLDELWKNLGLRDFKETNIENKAEYFLNIPILVREKKLLNSIKLNTWAQNTISIIIINKNKLQDHFPLVYVKSIMLRMEQVKQYYIFKNKYSNRDMDWKIGVSSIIEDLLRDSENDKKTLDSHLKNMGYQLQY